MATISRVGLTEEQYQQALKAQQQNQQFYAKQGQEQPTAPLTQAGVNNIATSNQQYYQQNPTEKPAGYTPYTPPATSTLNPTAATPEQTQYYNNQAQSGQKQTLRLVTLQDGSTAILHPDGSIKEQGDAKALIDWYGTGGGSKYWTLDQTGYQAPAPVAPTGSPSTDLPQQGSPISPAPQSSPTMPSMPSVGSPSGVSALEQAYQQSLTPTGAENDIQAQMAKAIAESQGLARGQQATNYALEAQPIARPFVTGQQAAVEKDYALQRGVNQDQQQTLQQRLALEQSKRQSAMDVSKFQLERADSQQSRQDQLAQQQYQNQFAQSQYQNQQTQQQFENQLATQELNQKGQETAQTKPIVSGGLSTSQDAIGQNINLLNQSKTQGAEADGVYADPNVYIELYQNWVSNGGQPADFYKYFPPNDYINPKNTWISSKIPGLDSKWTAKAKPPKASTSSSSGRSA